MKRSIFVVLSMVTFTMFIPIFTPSAHALSQRFKDAHQQEMNK
jgi:hypothetical protein